MCEACPIMVDHNASDVLSEDVPTLARFNPGPALEGWLAGYWANGDEVNATLCEAALDVQQTWKDAAQRVEP